MDEIDARQFIRVFTLANTDPTLSVEEIDQLVQISKRQDLAHFPPTSTSWTPTWRLAYGVKMGWKLKASKLVTAYDIDSSTQSLHRSQMYEQCMKMMREWQRYPTDSIQLVGALRDRWFVGTQPFPISNATEADPFLMTYWVAWGTRNFPWWENPEDLRAVEDFADFGYNPGYSR